MEVLKKLRFGGRVAAFVANTIICWIGMELAGLVRFRRPRIELINKWLPFWAGINLWIFGVKVEKHGPYADEGRLYPRHGANGVGRVFVANHSSGFDIPIMFTVAEAHCISRHDVAHWPLIGPGARRVGTLFVDRSSLRSGASVLKEVDESLERGEGVAMFPEGTTTPGDEVREFRTGAFNAARRAGAEVVPLGIAYGDEAAYYHNSSFMEHIKQIAGLRRLHVAVEVGQPLATDDYSSVEMKDVARQQVQELVNRARARLERTS
jgi:1-acyl-sn-glycerol-3-phosphate acyltransferase